MRGLAYLTHLAQICRQVDSLDVFNSGLEGYFYFD